ncbi:hypothetical protein SAMN02910289_01062 [Lachnospiraceae bacterium RM5]|nr:hypothetical protein SAMN02910289_01062 [Lachnospiraceae bacterium RM5]
MVLKDELDTELSRLYDIKNKVEKELVNVPEGSLRIGKSGGCPQYYYRKKGESNNGSYIAKKNIEFVKQLAQKTYDKKIKKLVDKRISQMEAFLRDYEDNEIELVYLKEHPERRKLVEPIELTYEQLVDEWINEPYVKKSFKSDMKVIITNSGIRVRSKSEKILADYFDSEGIKYKYECPLELKPYGVIYPDFTFISPRTKKEIYWEHEGMMDNPEYARTAVAKIESYESNGIFPGEDLILTFETSNYLIDMELIKRLTKKYLK